MKVLDFIEAVVRVYFAGVVVMLALMPLTLVFFIVLSKVLKKPLNSILDMYKISPQINILSSLLVSLTSWAGVLVLFIGVFSVSATRLVEFLIASAVNLFTSSNSKNSNNVKAEWNYIRLWN